MNEADRDNCEFENFMAGPGWAFWGDEDERNCTDELRDLWNAACEYKDRIHKEAMDDADTRLAQSARTIAELEDEIRRRKITLKETLDAMDLSDYPARHIAAEALTSTEQSDDEAMERAWDDWDKTGVGEVPYYDDFVAGWQAALKHARGG